MGLITGFKAGLFGHLLGGTALQNKLVIELFERFKEGSLRPSVLGDGDLQKASGDIFSNLSNPDTAASTLETLLPNDFLDELANKFQIDRPRIIIELTAVLPKLIARISDNKQLRKIAAEKYHIRL